MQKGCCICFALVSSVVFSSGLPSIAAEAADIRVTSAQAACIAENVDAYLASGRDPVVVVPETCPDQPTSDDLMAALAPRNSGAGLPEPKVGEPDAALVMLRSELECFAHLITGRFQNVRDDELLVVSLDACAD